MKIKKIPSLKKSGRIKTIKTPSPMGKVTYVKKRDGNKPVKIS